MATTLTQIPVERLNHLEHCERELSRIRGDRKPLTPATKRTLETIAQLIHEGGGVSPTMQEVADTLGLSKVSVYEHFNVLEKKGWIVREKRHSRSVRLV